MRSDSAISGLEFRVGVSGCSGSGILGLGVSIPEFQSVCIGTQVPPWVGCRLR